MTVSIELILLPRVSPSGAQQAHASSPRSRAQKPAPWSLRRLRAAAALPFSSGSKVLGREGLGGEAGAGPQRRDLRDFEEMKSMVGWRDR